MMMGKWVYHLLGSVQWLEVTEAKAVIRVALTGAGIEASGIHGVGPIWFRRRARPRHKSAIIGAT